MGELVSGCFKPSQPQRIISGLRETFIKRYIVERTDKAEIRPKEQNEKAESCQENLWSKIQLKGPQRDSRTEEKECPSSVGLGQKHKPQHPKHVKVSQRGPLRLAMQQGSLALATKYVIYTIGKADMRATPSPRSFLDVVF